MTTPASQLVPSTSKPVRIVGLVLSILVSLYLLMPAVMKIVQPPAFMEQVASSGIDPSLIRPLGITLLISTLLYMLPFTSALGAILLTGYLGGAISTHVLRMEPFWMQALLGVVVWLGLFLRDARVRSLIPLRSLG